MITWTNTNVGQWKSSDGHWLIETTDCGTFQVVYLVDLVVGDQRRFDTVTEAYRYAHEVDGVQEPQVAQENAVFSSEELERLAVYRSAVRSGFFNEGWSEPA